MSKESTLLPSKQEGFSAVELLITLFIGFMFIMMGYQLYSTIIADSGESRQRAAANNLAYAELRKYAGSTAAQPGSTSSCNSEATTGYITSSNVSNIASGATMTINICRPPNLATLRRVTVKINLGNQQEIVHAIYVEA